MNIHHFSARRLLLGAVAAVGMSAVTSSAGAAYTTGFETADDAGYVAGSTYDGVDGWTAVRDTDPAQGMLVSTDLVKSGSQAGSLVHNGNVNQMWNDFSAETTGATWIRASFSIALREDAQRNDSDINLTNIYFGTDTHSTTSNFSVSDAAIHLGFGGTVAQPGFFYRDGSSVVGQAKPFEFGTYYDVVVDLHTDTQTFDLSISGPGGPDLNATGLAFRSNISDIKRLVVSANGNHMTFFIDDVSVEVVPEPASLSLLGLGGLLALRPRRMALWDRR